jgi:hypothetical protein
MKQRESAVVSSRISCNHELVQTFRNQLTSNS